MRSIALLVTLLMTASVFAAKNQNSKFRMGLGVAHPSYLGDESPTGVIYNEGFGATLAHATTNSTPSVGVTSLSGHFGHDNFGLLGTYKTTDQDPKPADYDETDFAGAVHFSIVTIGANDNDEIGALFDITESFRFGLKSNSESNVSTLGVAYDVSSVSFAVDYSMDSDTGAEDWNRISLGAGFYAAQFFAGVKHVQMDSGVAKSNATTYTLGYDAMDWILGVELASNDTVDATKLWFTYNF